MLTIKRFGYVNSRIQIKSHQILVRRIILKSIRIRKLMIQLLKDTNTLRILAKILLMAELS